MNQADAYSDLDGSSVYSSCAFSRRTKSRISPTEDKAKKKKTLPSQQSPCLLSLPLSSPFFRPSLPPLLYLSPGDVSSSKRTLHADGGLNLPSMLQRRPWGGGLIEVFKTRVKKRIDRIKRVRLLHIPYHTQPRWPGDSVANEALAQVFERGERVNENDRERERTGNEEDRRVGDNIVDKRRKVAFYTL